MATQEPTSNCNMVCEKDLWLQGFVEDRLYLEMCEGKKMSIRKQSIFTGELYFENDNKYYAEAATYAGRISGGDFSGANARCTPVFRLNVEDFSPKLKAELAALPKERIHEVVTEAVFRIFRARHKMIFYRYIENHRLRWEFV